MQNIMKQEQYFYLFAKIAGIAFIMKTKLYIESSFRRWKFDILYINWWLENFYLYCHSLKMLNPGSGTQGLPWVENKDQELRKICQS